MNLSMQMRLMSDSHSELERLAGTPFAGTGLSTTGQPEVSHVHSVPGATHGWFELLVDWGVVGLPLSTLGNLIASWLWRVFENRQTPDRKRQFKVILRQGEAFADVDIDPENYDRTREALEKALRHVNREP